MCKTAKRLTAIALCTMFTAMQVSATTIQTGDTGLGGDLGGASIKGYTGGYLGTDLGENSATLNFNGNSHIIWDALNVGKGETLYFNATDGSSGLTIVNTVAGSEGSSRICGVNRSPHH